MPKKVPPPYFGYMTPEQQRKAAEDAARAAMLPTEQTIAAQRAESERIANERVAQQRAAAQAIAQLLSGAGQQVSGVYNQAAQTQGAFGKGFSQGLQDALRQSQEQGNAFLAKQGSPAQVAPNAESAGDVLYAMGGAIPGSTFSTQGAAFGAAASFLPSTALGRGEQYAQQTYRDADEERRDLDRALLELKARYPSYYQEALQALHSEQMQARAASINEQYLLNTMRSTGANITGYDPISGLPTYEASSAAAAANTKAQAAKTAARSKAVANRSQALTEARRTVIELAEGLKGKPLESGKTYLGRWVKKGGGYTNNLAEAEYEGRGTWKQVFDLAFASIADDLKARFAVKDAEIRRLIRQRLIALGFKPPASRPKVSRGLRKYPR